MVVKSDHALEETAELTKGCSAEWKEGDSDRNGGTRKDHLGISEIGIRILWLEGPKQGRERWVSSFTFSPGAQRGPSLPAPADRVHSDGSPPLMGCRERGGR